MAGWRSLCVGLNRYPERPLRLCEAEARMVHLEMKSFGDVCSDHTLLLNPTQQDLEHALSRFQEPNEACRFYFFFAGHGSRHDGELFFAGSGQWPNAVLL